MIPPPTVTEVQFVRASEGDQQRGLLGFVSFLLNDVLLVDGVALRRRRDGALTLSFPEPTDVRGKRHRPIYPIDQEARRVIESRVLAQLALSGVEVAL
jgi:hypothetical protein